MCTLFVHILLGGAFPRRHRANCGVIAIIRKVPILGRHRVFIGKGTAPEVGQGALTTGRRGPGVGRAPWWCGHPVPPLRLLFRLLEVSVNIWMFGFCFVKF
jgi:hypothetical protein